MRVSFVLLLASCGQTVVCGPGTALRNGECVTAAPVESCADGGIIIGGACFPDPSRVCGPNTTWDPVSQRCVGDSGSGECADVCGPPATGTVCIQGRVFDFVAPETPAAPTASSHAVVRAYNPLSFVSDPQNATVLGQSDIGEHGCYKIDGVPTPSSGLVAVSVTDASSPQGGTYAVAGAGAVLAPSRNVQLDAYFITRATVDTWSQQVGGEPAVCGGLLPCGLWIGQYLDSSGNPVAGVAPTRPGQATPASAVFCFRGDRMHLSTEDTTDGTGLCILSPDDLGTHTGTCAPAGCSCGGSPCTPSFPGVTGGTAPGVAFFQPIKAM